MISTILASLPSAVRRPLGIAGVVIISLLAWGCSDSNGPVGPNQSDYFSLEFKYDSLRIMPGGAAVVPLRLVPQSNFFGSVHLSPSCDSVLHLEGGARSISVQNPVTEYVVSIDTTCDTLQYSVIITGYTDEDTTHVALPVNVVMWSPQVPDIADSVRDQLLDWVEATFPALEDWSTQSWESFKTYPQVLVVEHVTFLSGDWEVRVCWHVMIPPHDWSMICIRRRGEWEAVLAARRESDGTTNEIPVDDYPEFWRL